MSKPAVLIIEDSASLALGYAAQLEEAGYEVTLAATLAEAEDALATSRFAATLLDLQLPDGDGLSLLEKRNATSPAFVVITADGSLSRAIAAMRLGAFDFLVKPVAGTRLLATIRSRCRKLALQPLPGETVEKLIAEGVVSEADVEERKAEWRKTLEAEFEAAKQQNSMPPTP